MIFGSLARYLLHQPRHSPVRPASAYDAERFSFIVTFQVFDVFEHNIAGRRASIMRTTSKNSVPWYRRQNRAPARASSFSIRQPGKWLTRKTGQ